jgi:hypothetical protein
VLSADDEKVAGYLCQRSAKSVKAEEENTAALPETCQIKVKQWFP